MPVGKARIAAKAATSPSSLTARWFTRRSSVADELATEGWEIEVVDLRSIKPLDTDTVMASVARTGRLLCVGESWPWGGVTAEVIARVASEGFGLLDVRRNGSTPKTRPCRITRTCGPRIARPRAAIGTKTSQPENSKLKIGIRAPRGVLIFHFRHAHADSHHHAAARRIHRRGDAIMSFLVQARRSAVEGGQDVIEVETNKANHDRDRRRAADAWKIHGCASKCNESYPSARCLG